MLHHVRHGATVQDLAKDASVVTMGINPTKAHLHLGHFITMLQAGRALHTNPKAVGMFFVDDREHHNKLLNGSNESTFILPRPHTTRKVQDLMTDFFCRIADNMKDQTILRRMRIQPMSEFMQSRVASEGGTQPVAGKLYDQLWQSRNEINRLFEFEGTSSMQYVRPFCGDCRTSVWPDPQVTADGEGILSECLEDRCPTGRLEVNPKMGDANWSMHYTVDPIRDALLSDQFHQRKVLHVFGGDYGIPWGIDGRPKAGRMSKLMDTVRPEMVEHFVGPMLVRDGEKLAKSNGDAHEAPDLRALHDMLATNKPVIEIAA